MEERVLKTEEKINQKKINQNILVDKFWNARSMVWLKPDNGVILVVFVNISERGFNRQSILICSRVSMGVGTDKILTLSICY